MPISFGNVGLAEPSTITKVVASAVIARGSTSEHQEILVIGDPQSSLGLSRVVAAPPVSTEFGQVVRIASGPSSAADLGVTIFGNSTVMQGTSPWTIAGNSTVIQGTSPWVISGNSTVVQGTSPWIIGGNSTVVISAGNSSVTISAGNSSVTISAGNSSVTISGGQSSVTISGNSTVMQGTSPWTIAGNSTVIQGTSPWIIGGNSTVVIASGNSSVIISAGNSSVVISGNSTAMQGTTPWLVAQNSTVWQVQDIPQSTAWVKAAGMAVDSSNFLNTKSVTLDGLGVGVESSTRAVGTNSTMRGLAVRSILPTLLTTSSSNVFASTAFTIATSNAATISYVYAYSIMTTNQTPTQISFYAGSTLVWPLVLAAISSAMSGANLAVSPPAYLFKSDTGAVLQMKTDGSTGLGYKAGVSYWTE